MGRRKLQPGEARDIRVVAYLTREEYIMLESMRYQTDESVSDVLRAAVLALARIRSVFMDLKKNSTDLSRAKP